MVAGFDIALNVPKTKLVVGLGKPAPMAFIKARLASVIITTGLIILLCSKRVLSIHVKSTCLELFKIMPMCT